MPFNTYLVIDFPEDTPGVSPVSIVLSDRQTGLMEIAQMMTRQYMWALLKSMVMATVLTVPLTGCLSLDEWGSSDPVSSGVSDVVISGSVGATESALPNRPAKWGAKNP